MQASVGWRPPKGALGTLVSTARERAAALVGRATELRDLADAAPAPPSFRGALADSALVQVIAEIKRRSPSRGEIAPELDAEVQARAYASGGAAAISVLTEASHFGGEIADLEKARRAGLPVLRKDFIIERIQLDEARAYGASAVLLIVRALPPDALAELHAVATEAGLATLVEVHTEDELRVAIEGGYPVIGVNNRDLETLAVDSEVAARLVPAIPATCIAVYESGVRTRHDVERAAGLGSDAVLVGSSLSGSGDPVAAVRGLGGVARRGRRAS